MLSAPIVEFLAAYWKASVMALTICLTFSLCLIARLWLREHRVGAVRKLAWSGVLLVPLFGWLFYGAFFRAPERDDSQGHVEHGGAAHANVD